MKTKRLTLVPATATLLRAEIENPGAFFKMLRVRCIEEWPPEDVAEVLPFFLEQLEQQAELVGWLSWYWVLYDGRNILGELVGGGGFKGKPMGAEVEIGYAVREPCRRKGYATEAVSGLVNWAFNRGVKKVIAETADDNVGSIMVLERLGFIKEGRGTEPEMIRFGLSNHSYA